MSATYIVLLGVQGAGKGTQAQILSQERGLPHVTTGGLFRAMKGQDTPLAREIQSIMDRGMLIPDDITIQVVRERLQQPDAQKGAIFDGFPRTLPQAKALDELLKSMGSRVKLVPFINLDRGVALRRLTSRWQCRNNDQHIYNVLEKPPRVAGKCDICGGELFQRADDTPEAVEKRINLFYEQTAPLIDYYRTQGVLHEINGDQPIETVTRELMTAIERVVS